MDDVLALGADTLVEKGRDEETAQILRILCAKGISGSGWARAEELDRAREGGSEKVSLHAKRKRAESSLQNTNKAMLQRTER